MGYFISIIGIIVTLICAFPAYKEYIQNISKQAKGVSCSVKYYKVSKHPKSPNIKRIKSKFSKINNDVVWCPISIINNSNDPIKNVFIMSSANIINFDKINLKSFNKNSIQKLPLNYSYLKYYNRALFFKQIPHGKFIECIGTDGSSMGGVRPSAAMFFTDSNNKEWVIDPQENLWRIKHADYMDNISRILWYNGISITNLTESYSNTHIVKPDDKHKGMYKIM